MCIQDCSNKLWQKIVLSDCISINIRVSIRVRGLHLVLLPAHFQPLPCTHAVRSRPRNSPHPFPVHSRPRSQPQPSAQPSSLTSPAASSPQPFPATLAPTPSAAVRAAKLADLQRLLFPLIAFPSFPFLSLPFPSFFLPFPSFSSFPFLSLPFPSFPFLSLPFLSFPFLSLAPTPSAHHRSNQLAPPRG